jgi:ABC-type transporter lipoprotein component MlaA
MGDISELRDPQYYIDVEAREDFGQTLGHWG